MNTIIGAIFQTSSTSTAQKRIQECGNKTGPYVNFWFQNVNDLDQKELQRRLAFVFRESFSNAAFEGWTHAQKRVWLNRYVGWLNILKTLITTEHSVVWGAGWGCGGEAAGLTQKRRFLKSSGSNNHKSTLFHMELMSFVSFSSRTMRFLCPAAWVGFCGGETHFQRVWGLRENKHFSKKEVCVRLGCLPSVLPLRLHTRDFWQTANYFVRHVEGTTTKFHIGIPHKDTTEPNRHPCGLWCCIWSLYISAIWCFQSHVYLLN